jgi:ATP-binding cassette subfamily B protein
MLSAGEMIVADIRERIFAHLQRLSLSFHASARSGDLVYRMTSDISDLKTILIDAPQNVTYRFLMICTHLGLMLFLEWRLTLIALSVMPLLYYFQRRFSSKVENVSRKKRSKESDVTSLIAENVTAMALVQAYGREEVQQARFVSGNRDSLECGITAMRLSKTFKRMNDILVALGTVGVVYFGGQLALAAAILPGTLVLFVAYLKKLYTPIDRISAMMLDLAKAQVAGERLLELVECDMVMQDAPAAVPAPSFKGRVEFRDVSFSYHQGHEVLKNFNFVVAPGETVALVGHSGAGKSTLVSLLLRFYDPQQGQVLIDGRDLREFTLKSLRRQITVLLQEAQLFNKTVRENIAFGKINATEEEIVRAAKHAQAHEFILRLPDEYDTIIDEGGENLSGGQKQRINMARAIIRRTPILILDEPATALDAKTEAKVQQALAALTRDKTTFIIAHKFSTIAHADQILLLEQGRLAAYGTHEELLRTNGKYRELYELQLRQPSEYADVTITASDAKANLLINS